MGNALDPVKDVVEPLVGKESPSERKARRDLRKQETQFKQQAEKQKSEERASALLESIKKRRKSGTAVRRLTALGLAGGQDTERDTLG